MFIKIKYLVFSITWFAILFKLCNENNILIIEDSACAVKSFYKGKACGTIGDMGIWSFDAMKTLSTADGGMMYIKNDQIRIIEFANVKIDLNKLLIVKNDNEFKINNTEKIILEQMINNPGKTFSREDIGKLIAIDKEANISTPFNTGGMIRGSITNKANLNIEIY